MRSHSAAIANRRRPIPRCRRESRTQTKGTCPEMEMEIKPVNLAGRFFAESVISVSILRIFVLHGIPDFFHFLFISIKMIGKPRRIRGFFFFSFLVVFFFFLPKRNLQRGQNIMVILLFFACSNTFFFCLFLLKLSGVKTLQRVTV